MVQVKRLGLFALIAVAAVFSVEAGAQAGDPAALIQQKPVTQFKVTKTTADRFNILTAGDIALSHDGVMMCGSASSYALSNGNRTKPGTDRVIAAIGQSAGMAKLGQRNSSTTRI